jgi:selenoprotein W-related protein
MQISSYSAFLLSLVVWSQLLACHVADAFVAGGASPMHAVPFHRSATDLAATCEEETTPEVFQIRIEYCTGCRWGLRGFWTAQELLTTFRDDRALGAVTVAPSAVAGRFVVTCRSAADSATTLLWDRQKADGFPEMKVLKQRVRDRISPTRFLGHSDAADRLPGNETDASKTSRTILDLTQRVPAPIDTTLTLDQIEAPTPHVSITYCTGCGWLLRAAYVAQELVLATFADEIAALSLIPSRPPAKGGAFVVAVDDTVIWDRTEQGRFPETKEVKQRVRDLLVPSKDLGHSDTTERKAEPPMDDLDNEASAEARKFFGVL